MSTLGSIKNLLLVSIIFYGVLKLFVLSSNADYDFQVSRTHVKFHANWTESISKLKHLSELHEAFKLPTIEDIDISFYMSSNLGYN